MSLVCTYINMSLNAITAIQSLKYKKCTTKKMHVAISAIQSLQFNHLQRDCNAMNAITVWPDDYITIQSVAIYSNDNFPRSKKCQSWYKSLPNTKKAINKVTQILSNFRQSGEFSPNLVTIIVIHKYSLLLSKSWHSQALLVGTHGHILGVWQLTRDEGS